MGQRRVLWMIVLLILPALACNAFAGSNGEPTLLPPPTAVNFQPTPEATSETEVGQIAPTATLPGSGEVAETPSATPGNPVALILVDLNVRSGPGVQYERLGFLTEGSQVALVGRDPASGWWKVQCPANVGAPECWVSGGAQYTQPFNTEGVPVAAVPPTPTPIPAVLPDDTGLLVFVDDGRLQATQLDTRQNPPVPAPTTLLDESPDVQQVAVAPNGRLVAYLVQVVDGNELRLVNIDGRSQRVLVRSADLPFVGSATELPELANENDPNQTVQLLTMQWLDDETLVFNTGVVNSAGFSPGPHSDLWTVDRSGDLRQRYSAGQAGPVYTISARNQVLFSRIDTIWRGNVDGSGLEQVISFEPVGISEAYYYPRPQWVADGDYAYVAISDQLFLNGGQVSQPTATLWQIPASGGAEKVGGLVSNVVFAAPRWSADGQRLGFVTVPAGSTQPELVLADAAGQRDVPYINEGEPRFWGWHENDEHFLYDAGRFYAVGRLGESSRRFSLADDEALAAGEWVSRAWFLTAVVSGSSGTVEYRLHDREGASGVVAVANGRLPVFDLWLP